VQAAESRHPSTWHRRAPAGPDVANGHDPDGVDLADFEEPRLEAVALSDFDPAEVDRRDFGEEPPAVTVNPAHPAAPPVMPTDDPVPTTGSPPGPAAATGIPTPRPAEPTVRTTPPGSGPRGGAGVDASLPVADLARSLRFYRDALGFAVAHTSSGSAIVEAEGLRILLDHVEDAAARTPRSGTIHLQVADIRATCDALRRRGVTLVEPPAAVNDGERMQLWRARLLDPDGHEITIIEWRHRR
jgi:catechol 2,3-dioxygenase-like lactoylglutathione lyase family enzyme